MAKLYIHIFLSNEVKSQVDRFGFVRFAHKKEAMMAMVKTNGLWVWNQTLVVNAARFVSKQTNTRYGNKQGKVTRSTGFKQGQVQNFSGFEKENTRYGNMQGKATRSTGFKQGQVQRLFGFEKGLGSNGNMRGQAVRNFEFKQGKDLGISGLNTGQASRSTVLKQGQIPCTTGSKMGKDARPKGLSFSVGKVLISSSRIETINQVITVKHKGKRSLKSYSRKEQNGAPTPTQLKTLLSDWTASYLP